MDCGLALGVMQALAASEQYLAIISSPAAISLSFNALGMKIGVSATLNGIAGNPFSNFCIN